MSTVTPADTSPAFVWGNQPSHLTSPALEDEPLSRDDSFALPDASMLQVPPASTLNYDDELSQLNSPQALFERCITCLRRQFEGQRDQLSYATNLWQYVMAREPFLLPPLFPPSNNRQSVSSPPRSTGGHRPPVYACVLCSGRPQFTSRGSLKRHVNRHRAKSEFRCPVPGCRWKRNRKDKVRDHLRRHGYPHGWSRAAIAQLEFPLPAPTECEICLKNPPFRSWDEWFECIESHCRLETPLPDHTPGLPDGQDGNGNGGTGGAGFGNGSSFPGPAGGGFLNPGASGDGMHFVSNGGGYSQPWLGPGYNVYMSDNFCPPDPSSASHHQVSTRPIALSAESRRSRSSGDSSDGSSSIHDGLNKKGPAELQPAEDGQDRTSQKCRRCGHVSTSCPECPPDPGPVEWCHTCKDNMPSPIASRLLNFIGSCDRYQDLACNGVSNRRNMRYAIGETVDRNLSRVYVVGYRPRRRSKLVSLKWKPKSIDSYPSPSTKTQKADRTATISKTPFPTSSELNQTALIYSLLQWEIVFRIVIGWTSFCFLGELPKGNSGLPSPPPPPYLLTLISDSEFPSKTGVDALTVSQKKTLGLIYSNPSTGRQGTMPRIHCCCLDSIQVEPTGFGSRSSKISQPWQCRRRLSVLLSQQTAIAASRSRK